MNVQAPAKRALAVGGFDPSAGAGVLLDAFVMARLGYQPAVVVTTVTAQNSSGFTGAWPIEPEALVAQLEAVLAEGTLSCVKIGALGSHQLALALAEWLAERPPVPVVLDPVLASSTGGLLVDSAISAVGSVAQVSTVMTPNAKEAMQLAGVSDARKAGRLLAELHGIAVVVTGLSGDRDGEAIDILCEAGKAGEAGKASDAGKAGKASDAGEAGEASDASEAGEASEASEAGRLEAGKAGRLEELSHRFIAEVGDVRGTGCMFSSALACHLASGLALADSLRAAQSTVCELLTAAAPLGRGRWQLDLARVMRPGR